MLLGHFIVLICIHLPLREKSHCKSMQSYSDWLSFIYVMNQFYPDESGLFQVEPHPHRMILWGLCQLYGMAFTLNRSQSSSIPMGDFGRTRKTSFGRTVICPSSSRHLQNPCQGAMMPFWQLMMAQNLTKYTHIVAGLFFLSTILIGLNVSHAM